jgi:hypothetical protein
MVYAATRDWRSFSTVSSKLCLLHRSKPSHAGVDTAICMDWPHLILHVAWTTVFWDFILAQRNQYCGHSSDGWITGRTQVGVVERERDGTGFASKTESICSNSSIDNDAAIVHVCFTEVCDRR